MGNGTSQTVVLGHSRTPAGIPYHQSRYQQKTPKYAHPHNRVLPKPVAGQRLRSTDNGHILHSAGTIRGLKSGSPLPQETEEMNSEVMDVLRKRSEMASKEQNSYHPCNLRNYRMFHSDPDISGHSRMDTGYSLDPNESGISRRAGGGVANKTTKLKHRKKARAPDPPANESFPRQYERRVQSSSDLRHTSGNSDCRCGNNSLEWSKTKCRAPAPPSVTVHPPPPPPPPLPTHISTTCSPLKEDQKLKNMDTQPFTTSRGPNCPSYQIFPEKNPRPDDNWRLSRSVGDLRIDESSEMKMGSPRTTVFDSKASISNCDQGDKKPALIPHQPDPFQKEIQAVTRKIAQNHQYDDKDKTEENDKKQTPKQVNSPKPYYFSDKDVFRADAKLQTKSQHESTKEGPIYPQKDSTSITKSNGKSIMSTENISQQTKVDKGINTTEESPLQRFSPDRRHLKPTDKNSSPFFGRKNDFENSQFYRHEDSDIDIRLRPVLPRKMLDIQNFSPIEAWHALGSDGQNSSNRSTSDDSTHPYDQRKIQHMQDNTPLKSIPSYKNNNSKSESLWTPRQDLEDSDTSSINSEDVVVPKNQLGEFSTRFSLPTVMFSNMRPIGTDVSLNNKTNYPPYLNPKTPKYRPTKEKPIRNLTSDTDLNGASHFKKFLGMRNKYLSEEDVSVSDSNWTFGGYTGLQQKKGKHYSSDLMLSDKKKYELIVRNDFGEFLGDILVTKANDMKNQIKKSSDSSNSNFSFYSTEGHVMYLPDSDNHLSAQDSSPTRNRGQRQYNIKKVNKTDQVQSSSKKYKKKLTTTESERKRSMEVVRMLEDDVRRRRNKEKISIRQQLQMMKSIDSDEDDDDEEEEVDEAYFTEPKSLEETSPLHVSPTQSHFLFSGSSTPCKTPQDLNHRSALTHWTSTPALFHDFGDKSPTNVKGFYSSSSINSSSESPFWKEHLVDGLQSKNKFAQNRRFFDKQRSVPEEDGCLALDGRSSSEDFRLPIGKDKRKMHQVAPAHQVKEKKTNSIYKQLMDIVRKEERHMKKEQANNGLTASRESSYSQRESSHSSSASSHDSMSSSASSYTDSSDQKTHRQDEYPGKSGVPANNEFHTSSGIGMDRTREMSARRDGNSQESKHISSPFHAAFAKPFTPNKGYRPVPFELPQANANCRMLTIQERHKIQAEVS